MAHDGAGRERAAHSRGPARPRRLARGTRRRERPRRGGFGEPRFAHLRVYADREHGESSESGRPCAAREHRLGAARSPAGHPSSPAEARSSPGSRSGPGEASRPAARRGRRRGRCGGTGGATPPPRGRSPRPAEHVRRRTEDGGVASRVREAACVREGDVGVVAHERRHRSRRDAGMRHDQHVEALDMPRQGTPVARTVRRAVGHLSLFARLHAAARRAAGRPPDQLQADSSWLTMRP